MKLFIIAVLLSLALAWVLFFLRKSSNRKIYAHPVAPGVIPSNSVFHKPLNAGCPQGTRLIPGYFTKEDGSKQDACHNPNGDGSIDYLNPGESFFVPIGIEVDDTGEPKA